MRFLSCLIFLLLLIRSCADQGGQRKTEVRNPEQENPGTAYAKKFRIQEAAEFRVLEVLDPWQNSKGVHLSYVLGREPEGMPDSLRNLPFIRIPVERVIAMSTTHVAMLTRLHAAINLVGLSGGNYIYDSVVCEAYQSGSIAEVGYDQGLNYEEIVRLNPEVLFFYGVEGSAGAVTAKLEELGIQVVYCAEYLEEHPLGRAEWIRFFGSFFEMESEADAMFSSIDSSYKSLMKIASGEANRPGVMIGLPWKDTWYIAGGRSFAARLIQDAGGNYLWAENDSREALALDLESVYTRAIEADIWINPGVAGSLQDLENFDPRFSGLPVLARGNVYNNDNRIRSGGGNDYWESATLRPDLVLSDLIQIFHPSLRDKEELYYYRKLK